MKKRKCDHEDFYAVRKDLEAKGQVFTREAMKRLCYSNLFVATIGNAGKQAGNRKDADAEQDDRLKVYEGLSADDLSRAEFCDSHEEYAAYQRLANALGILKDEDASPEVLLYRNMTRLRGDWSGGRSSFYLEEIYRLIEVCKGSGILPNPWLGAVKLNADTFDGHFNDGRIMRDGAMHLPEEVVAAMGLPAEMAKGASGNLAKMMGAVKRPGEYCGSYEELLKDVLTPAQRVDFMRPEPESEGW